MLAVLYTRCTKTNHTMSISTNRMVKSESVQLLSADYTVHFLNSVLLLNTIKYRRRPMAKVIYKTFDVLKKYLWGKHESLNQNALMIFLKNISKDMKCLEKSKLVQVLVWNFTSLVDVIRRQTYEYKNTLVLQHLILMHTSRSHLRIWNKKFFVTYQDTSV